MEASKACDRCAETKSLDQFYNNRAQRDGKDGYCKPCRINANSANPKRREYNRIAGARWRAANPEKVKAKSKREYWKDVEKSRARLAAWAKENPEARKDIALRYRHRHPERYRDQQRKSKRLHYAKNKEKLMPYIREWQRANPEKRKETHRRFYEEHAAEIALQSRRYYAHRDRATPKWANPFFMSEAYSLARLRTQVTGYKWAVDHIVPLNSKIVCGLHTHTNLQVIPFVVNAVKSNKRWPDMPAEALSGNL